MLRVKGYRILDRRWKSPAGELDLVIRRGRTVAFVEVKTRPTDRSRRLPPSVRSSAAESYLRRTTGWQQNPDAMDCDCRFDIVTVTPYQWPRHIANAFAADDQ
jgi:putative endonuclease